MSVFVGSDYRALKIFNGSSEEDNVYIHVREKKGVKYLKSKEVGIFGRIGMFFGIHDASMDRVLNYFDENKTFENIHGNSAFKIKGKIERYAKNSFHQKLPKSVIDECRKSRGFNAHEGEKTIESEKEFNLLSKEMAEKFKGKQEIKRERIFAYVENRDPWFHNDDRICIITQECPTDPVVLETPYEKGRYIYKRSVLEMLMEDSHTTSSPMTREAFTEENIKPAYKLREEIRCRLDLYKSKIKEIQNILE